MRPRRLGGLPRCPRNVHLSGTFDRKLTVIQLTVWWVSKRVGIKIACPYMHRKVTATGEIYNACVIPSMDCARAGQTPLHHPSPCSARGGLLLLPAQVRSQSKLEREDC